MENKLIEHLLKMLPFQNISILLDVILARYFLDSRCFFLLIDDQNYNIFLSKPIIPIVIIKISTTNIVLDEQLIFHNFGCQEIIIWAENSSEILTNFEKTIKFGKERWNRRTYIVFTYDLPLLFQNKALKHITNFLAIKLNNNNKSFELFTHFPHSPHEAKLLDVWFPGNTTFLYNNSLFPNKLKNQNGRKLNIGTLDYRPYSIVDEKNGIFDGTETRFIFEFLNKYNITPSFKVMDDSWGDIYENWTGIGLLGNLAEDTIDLGYAAVYCWDIYYNYLECTQALYRSGVTALVPAPKLANGLLTPLFSFSTTTWILIAVSFVANILLLFFLMKRQNISRNCKTFYKSLYAMTRMLLLQPLNLPISGRIMKYFFALNLVYVLLITTSYSSGLSSIMTVPRYEPAINSVKDLAESGLNWGGTTEAWLYSLAYVNQTDYIKIKQKFVAYPEEKLVEVSQTYKFGFIMERLPYGYYAIGSYVRRDVISNYRIMQDDIYWAPCTFMTPKNSVLLPLLNKMLLQVFEAGLGQYWENKVVYNYMDMPVQRAIRYHAHHTSEHVVVKLKWIHVEGAFTLLLIGYLAAGVAFICEIFGKNGTGHINI